VIETESQAGSTPSQNSTSRMHLKKGRRAVKVHTCGRVLLRGWWWPVGPKLVFDQMAAPVPESMDDCLYAWLRLVVCCNHIHSRDFVLPLLVACTILIYNRLHTEGWWPYANLPEQCAPWKTSSGAENLVLQAL
jgi:hypothetical protein